MCEGAHCKQPCRSRLKCGARLREVLCLCAAVDPASNGVNGAPMVERPRLEELEEEDDDEEEEEIVEDEDDDEDEDWSEER